MNIYVDHIRDGMCEYNSTQFHHGKCDLGSKLQQLYNQKVEVKTNDVIPSIHEDNDEDSYFYVINHRQIGFDEDGVPFIIYWVDDLDESDLFKEVEK